MSNETSDMTKSCPVCRQIFSDERTHLDHAVAHWGCKYLFCDECGSSFNNRSKLIRHLLIHSGVKSHKCSVCEAKFNNPSSLRKHKLIHSESKPYTCNICGSAFRDSSNFRKHVLKHQGLKYACTQCDKTYKGRWHLYVHMKSHTNDASWSCLCCSKMFYTKKDRNRHELTHSDTKNFKCILCDTNFRRKDNLDRHFRNAHPDPASTPTDLTEIKKGKKRSASNSNLIPESSKMIINIRSEDDGFKRENCLLHAGEGCEETLIASPTKEAIEKSIDAFELKSKPSLNTTVFTKSEDETRLKIIEANNKRESVIFMRNTVEKRTENDNFKNSNPESVSSVSKDDIFDSNFNAQYNGDKLIDRHKPQYCRDLYRIDNSNCAPNSMVNADFKFYNESIIHSTVEKSIEFSNKIDNVKDKNENQEPVYYDVGDDYSPLSPTYSQFDDEKARWRIHQLASQNNQTERSEPINYSPETLELYKKILLVPFKSSAKKTLNANLDNNKLKSAYKNPAVDDKLRNNDNINNENCTFNDQTQTSQLNFGPPIQDSPFNNPNFTIDDNQYFNSNYNYMYDQYWRIQDS